MTIEDILRDALPPRPQPPAPNPAPLCGDTVGWGFEDTISCQKRSGHDDLMSEMGGRRRDLIHQASIDGDPVLTVTWHR